MTGSHRSRLRELSRFWPLFSPLLFVALAVALYLQAVQVSRLQAQVRVAQQGVAVLRQNDWVFDKAIMAIAGELGMLPEKK